jgi:hypothetical protein
MNESDVMRKVKSLLRLGESSNENEAAVAIGKAQALMEQHSISQAMLETPAEEDAGPIRAWEDPLAKKTGRWQGSLSVYLSRANGCQVYRSQGFLRIIGRAPNVQTVRYLFSYCSHEIERLTNQHRGNGRTWLNNFRLGCVEAIHDSIKRERAAIRDSMRQKAETQNSDGRALMVVNRAIVKVDNEYQEALAFGRYKLGLRAGSSSRSTYDPGARETGRKAGASIYSGNRARIGECRKQIK